MKIMLLDKSRIVNLLLPSNVYGNYWITNALSNNLVNIEAVDGKWIVKSNSDVKVYNNNVIVDSLTITNDLHFVLFSLETNSKYEVYCSNVYNENSLRLKFYNAESLTFYIGNNLGKKEGNIFANWISYENDLISYNQIQVSCVSGKIYLKNLNTEVPLYVNNYIFSEGEISNGDIIFILGLRFSIINDLLLLINPSDLVKYDASKLVISEPEEVDYSQIDKTLDSPVEVFEAKDYFLRPPRFSERVEPKEFGIDAPPAEYKEETLPMILTMGPMVIMGMGSCVTGVLALLKVMSGEATLKSSISSIITAICMIGSMIIFPTITKKYTKRSRQKKEKLRQKKYGEYLETKRKEIQDEMRNQMRILTDTNVSLNNVADVIAYRKRNLWERMPEHPDFLELRFGLGSVPPAINLGIPESHFTLEEDELKQRVYTLKDEIKMLNDVPVTLSLKERFVSALIGNLSIDRKFVEGLILQMVAYHSWNNLKIVILTNQDNITYWERFKNIPYCWDDGKSIRFFGTNIDEISKISNYLEEVFNNRKGMINEEKKTNFNTCYLIITDDIEGTRNVSILENIMKCKTYLGFSILYLTDKLNNLSNEVKTFVNISANEGGIFESELVSNKRISFKPDFIDFDIKPYLYTVANIPIDLNEGKYELPSMLSFLEMYDVSNVKQLNSFNRWKSNDPTKSLSVPIGVNQSGDLFKLDLHEKAHGPHGLIAGMTGSGKSEFIITYILSMAVNFSPLEVNFVLIDYKGGGLAGAFENKETGIKLPHLAGSITNLDVGEINRSLASLNSELKRRQKIFNEARDSLGESTIDIYKYQKLFREGKVKQAVPHLFIISDEFAELKAQQPEFMSELISTARIGRSLGVHLILATQKPSGVVDDQIWSNSKFRVCLKVQDRMDSNDMIKSNDAALLKDTGRFYLQVGYNEFFALGQSAWCGAPYFESDKRRKKINTSLDFIDNTGNYIKNIENSKNNDIGVRKGEELSNVLKYIIETAKLEDLKAQKLWLDPILDYIYIDNLRTKYKFKKTNFVLNPIIGEYDAPSKQKKGLLTLPISREGNTLVYGMVGSGKDNLISSLVYSLITTYSVDEVNIYALDFGAETLKLYRNAPQIGGLVYSGEKDRVANLFKLIRSIIEERKRLFVQYNGSYDAYIENSGNSLPNVVLIINNYESFNDSYSEYFDQLVTITREGVKYGVFVVVTVSGVGGIRNKLAQNFGLQFTLQMNDNYDYRSIVGRTEVFPSKIMGRGLIKLDDIYEFQTAYPETATRLSERVKIICEALNKKYSNRAQHIPELPDVVSTSFVKPAFMGLHSVPIGVEKDTLNIRTVDIKNNPSTLITGLKFDTLRNFVSCLVKEMAILSGKKIFVFDAERLLKNDEVTSGCKYFQGNFENALGSLNELINQLNDVYVKSDYDVDSLTKYEDNVCIFIGLDKLKIMLGDKFNSLFSEPIEVAKKMLKFNYIFVDTVDTLKKMEYDGWYKSVVNSSRGIWIGNGLAEQNLLKLNVSSRNLANNILDGFGYDIVGGNPCLVKLIETYEQEEYDTL